MYFFVGTYQPFNKVGYFVAAKEDYEFLIFI